jgi:hypothetical protein
MASLVYLGLLFPHNRGPADAVARLKGPAAESPAGTHADAITLTGADTAASTAAAVLGERNEIRA